MTRCLDRSALRLLFVTDGRGDEARIEDQVRAVVDGGVRAVQVREPKSSAAALVRLGERLLPVLRAVRGLLFVNDRIDCARTGVFDGVQLGHRSVPWPLARRAAGDDVLLSCSVHDEGQVLAAEEAGADLALLAPVWPTASKPGVAALGLEVAARWTASSSIPLVWLGGVDAGRIEATARVPVAGRPSGFAVLSGLAGSADPRAAAANLCRAARAVLAATGD